MTPDLANLYLKSILVLEISRKYHFVFHWLDLGRVSVLEPVLEPEDCHILISLQLGL